MKPRRETETESPRVLACRKTVQRALDSIDAHAGERLRTCEEDEPILEDGVRDVVKDLRGILGIPATEGEADPLALPESIRVEDQPEVAILIGRYRECVREEDVCREILGDVQTETPAPAEGKTPRKKVQKAPKKRAKSEPDPDPKPDPEPGPTPDPDPNPEPDPDPESGTGSTAHRERREEKQPADFATYRSCLACGQVGEANKQGFLPDTIMEVFQELLMIMVNEPDDSKKARIGIERCQRIFDAFKADMDIKRFQRAMGIIFLHLKKKKAAATEKGEQYPAESLASDFRANFPTLIIQ